MSSLANTRWSPATRAAPMSLSRDQLNGSSTARTSISPASTSRASASAVSGAWLRLSSTRIRSRSGRAAFALRLATQAASRPGWSRVGMTTPRMASDAMVSATGSAAKPVASAGRLNRMRDRCATGATRDRDSSVSRGPWSIETRPGAVITAIGGEGVATRSMGSNVGCRAGSRCITPSRQCRSWWS